MVIIGSYLLTSRHIRYKIGSKRDVYDNCDAHSVNLTPSRLKDRCDLVFKMVPGRMKKLVIVNSTLSTFGMIQACAEVAEKYADEVMVIPPLLALITNALESIANRPNPRVGEIILVVIITSKFADYVVLHRDRNFVLYVAKYDRFAFDQCEEKFQSFYKDFCPDTTTFLADEPLRYVADKIIREKLMHKNWFIKTFKRWDFALSYGAMLRADDTGFDPRYRIANFSSGYYAEVYNGRTRKKEKLPILPEQSPLPCKMYGINCSPQPIKLFYFKDYEQLGNELVLKEHAASYHKMQLTGSSTQLLGYVDHRGVPYAQPPGNCNRRNTISYHLSGFKNRNPSVNASAAESAPAASSADEEISSQAHSAVAESAPAASSADEGISSQAHSAVAESAPAASSADEGISSQSTSIVADPLQVKFLFFDNWCATEICQNGVAKLVADSSGNKWKPLYLSVARGEPVTGKEARKDYEKFPKRVIYDVLKVIGKSKKEIKVDPKWGFKLEEIIENVCFQVETSSGPLFIPFETVLGEFLKAMKLDAQSVLGNVQLKEVRVSTCFGLSEAQKFLFHKAAEKNGLQILSFDEIAF